MIIDDILKEKYKIQKKLSESALDIHDYFNKSHDATVKIAKEYGIKLKYGKLPTKLAIQNDNMRIEKDKSHLRSSKNDNQTIEQTPLR